MSMRLSYFPLLLAEEVAQNSEFVLCLLVLHSLHFDEGVQRYANHSRHDDKSQNKRIQPLEEKGS